MSGSNNERRRVQRAINDIVETARKLAFIPVGADVGQIYRLMGCMQVNLEEFDRAKELQKSIRKHVKGVTT